MVFSNEKIPPVLNKILEEIMNISKEENTISLDDLRKKLINFRLTKDDINNLIRYFQDNGYLERKGNTIHIISNDVTVNEKKRGRPKKLTKKERNWINENYQPGVYGITKLTNEINKNRDEDPVCPKTVYNSLSF